MFELVIRHERHGGLHFFVRKILCATRRYKKLIVKSLINGFGLIEDKEYTVIFEYDSVYEVELDNGYIACRNKDFFLIVQEN